jgi:hypothetical protein
MGQWKAEEPHLPCVCRRLSIVLSIANKRVASARSGGECRRKREGAREGGQDKYGVFLGPKFEKQRRWLQRRRLGARRGGGRAYLSGREALTVSGCSPVGVCGCRTLSDRTLSGEWVQYCTQVFGGAHRRVGTDVSKKRAPRQNTLVSTVDLWSTIFRSTRRSSSGGGRVL